MRNTKISLNFFRWRGNECSIEYKIIVKSYRRTSTASSFFKRNLLVEKSRLTYNNLKSFKTKHCSYVFSYVLANSQDSNKGNCVLKS